MQETVVSINRHAYVRCRPHRERDTLVRLSTDVHRLLTRASRRAPSAATTTTTAAPTGCGTGAEWRQEEDVLDLVAHVAPEYIDLGNGPKCERARVADGPRLRPFGLQQRIRDGASSLVRVAILDGRKTALVRIGDDQRTGMLPCM